MTKSAIDPLWYATFYVIALGVGWAIASTNSGEKMVPVGLGVSVVVGPVLAQLSKLARKLSVDKHSVRVELHDFRFTWIWTTIWFGGALIGAWAVMDQVFYTSSRVPSIVVMGSAGLIVGAWFARIAGKKSEYLRVDLAAGIAEYCGWGTTLACPLAELGRFEVETYRRVNASHRGHRPEWHRLTVPGFPNREIADSVYPGGVRKLAARLQRELDHLRDISAVRRALADTPTDDAATYRAGPSLEEALKAAVEDPARRAAALRYLRRDREPEIAARARALT